MAWSLHCRSDGLQTHWDRLDSVSKVLELKVCSTTPVHFFNYLTGKITSKGQVIHISNWNSPQYLYLKNTSCSWMSWHTPLIQDLRRQRHVDLGVWGQPGLHRETLERGVWGRWPICYKYLLFQITGVNSQHQTVSHKCNSGSKGSEIFFWLPWILNAYDAQPYMNAKDTYT